MEIRFERNSDSRPAPEFPQERSLTRLGKNSYRAQMLDARYLFECTIEGLRFATGVGYIRGVDHDPTIVPSNAPRIDGQSGRETVIDFTEIGQPDGSIETHVLSPRSAVGSLRR